MEFAVAEVVGALILVHKDLVDKKVAVLEHLGTMPIVLVAAVGKVLLGLGAIMELLPVVDSPAEALKAALAVDNVDSYMKACKDVPPDGAVLQDEEGRMAEDIEEGDRASLDVGIGMGMDKPECGEMIGYSAKSQVIIIHTDSPYLIWVVGWLCWVRRCSWRGSSLRHEWLTWWWRHRRRLSIRRISPLHRVAHELLTWQVARWYFRLWIRIGRKRKIFGHFVKVRFAWSTND